MLERFFVLLIFISASIYNVKSADAFYPEPVFFVQDDNYFLHTVERGQTVYSIATMYHVKVDEIFSLNSGSKNVIREGQKLKVPQQSGSYIYHTVQPQETLYGVSKKYNVKSEDIVAVNPGLSVKTFQIGKIIRIPVNIITTSVQGGNEAKNIQDANTLLTQSQPIKAVASIKIALLLPFELKEKADNRMVEYYEGFLLALKEVKNQGISVDLQVYDVGTDMKKLPDILKKDEMQDVHLIIGGFSEQIKQISRFATDRDISYVIPFASESDEPFYNPNVYQINPPQSYLYSKASLAFVNRYKNDNIFLISEEKDTSNKTEFINALRNDLQIKNIPYQIVPNDVLLSETFVPQLDLSKKNIFVPADDAGTTLEQIIAALKTISESNPEYSLSLFGYTRWQVYGQKYAEDFFKLNVSFFTSFYTNPVAPEVKTFYNSFFRWYSRTISNVFPKYGILGYDTGLFFIKAINQYGASFGKKINEVKYDGVQTGFHFERVNNWGGFINTGLYFVDYNNDYSITKNFINRYE
jgi:LysM repeat protein